MNENLVGTVFGPYRIDEMIGRGGMGAVYRAFDTQRDREVALKLLGGTTADDGTFAERFRRECQLVARLGEPHIIPIHDYGEIDGTLYLDMRLVEGDNLRHALRRRGAMPVEEAVSVIEQIGDALDAAHKAGLVHRDVKPENVLLTPTGFAYLVDFGIAQDGAESGLTRAGTAIGSTAYMAPELFDNVPASASSDVYALSAVLFELLTGRTPYAGDTVTSIIKAAVLNDVPSASAANPAVPQALDSVLAIGLAKDPAGRFTSAAQLGAAARAALTGEAPTSFVPASRPTVVHPTTAVPNLQQGTGPQPATAPQPERYSGPVDPAAYAGTQYAQVPPQVSGPMVVHPSGPVGMQYSGPVGYTQPHPPPERASRSNIVLLFAIGILIAVLIALGAYYLVYRGPADSLMASAQSSTTTITSTIEPTRAAPPSWSTPCNEDVGVGSPVTTCGFAINVRSAYLAGGRKGDARTVVASSPATGLNYTMSCAPESGIIVCRGGDNAVVHVY
ncbi:MAG: protein kinase [Gordonia sp. (in: high G+C Gram-positive bacteria)]|uniref:serine/threonine-protein kinase n=1 Tax=Gordonia sp. (in: high G+C Gram-positive bacteria) TaxID=84139 RepID=UPI0039E4BC7A